MATPSASNGSRPSPTTEAVLETQACKPKDKTTQQMHGRSVSPHSTGNKKGKRRHRKQIPAQETQTLKDSSSLAGKQVSSVDQTVSTLNPASSNTSPPVKTVKGITPQSKPSDYCKADSRGTKSQRSKAYNDRLTSYGMASELQKFSRSATHIFTLSDNFNPGKMRRLCQEQPEFKAQALALVHGYKEYLEKNPIAANLHSMPKASRQSYVGQHQFIQSSVCNIEAVLSLPLPSEIMAFLLETPIPVGLGRVVCSFVKYLAPIRDMMLFVNQLRQLAAQYGDNSDAFMAALREHDKCNAGLLNKSIGHLVSTIAKNEVDLTSIPDQVFASSLPAVQEWISMVPVCQPVLVYPPEIHPFPAVVPIITEIPQVTLTQPPLTPEEELRLRQSVAKEFLIEFCVEQIKSVEQQMLAAFKGDKSTRSAIFWVNRLYTVFYAASDHEIPMILAELDNNADYLVKNNYQRRLVGMILDASLEAAKTLTMETEGNDVSHTDVVHAKRMLEVVYASLDKGFLALLEPGEFSQDIQALNDSRKVYQNHKCFCAQREAARKQELDELLESFRQQSPDGHSGNKAKGASPAARHQKKSDHLSNTARASEDESNTETTLSPLDFKLLETRTLLKASDSNAGAVLEIYHRVLEDQSLSGHHRQLIELGISEASIAQARRLLTGPDRDPQQACELFNRIVRTRSLDSIQRANCQQGICEAILAEGITVLRQMTGYRNSLVAHRQLYENKVPVPIAADRALVHAIHSLPKLEERLFTIFRQMQIVSEHLNPEGKTEELKISCGMILDQIQTFLSSCEELEAARINLEELFTMRGDYIRTQKLVKPRLPGGAPLLKVSDIQGLREMDEQLSEKVKSAQENLGRLQLSLQKAVDYEQHFPGIEKAEA